MSIAVAAADCPDELVRRRDGIAKSLFCFQSAATAGSPEEAKQQQQQQPQQPAAGGSQVDGASKCCSSGGSRKSFMDEADELQDALDNDFALLDEVLRIKKILDNKNEECESSLFESLRRLQLMELTVTTLTVTDIQNSVRGVEGHGSKRVRQIARILLDGWAELLGDFSNTAEPVTDTPDATANSLDDPWLNFPPLDEGALRAIHGPPIDLAELFSEKPRKIRIVMRDSVKRADEACEEERKQENDSEPHNTLSTSGKRKREDAVDQSETLSRSGEPHNTWTKRGRTTSASSKTSGKDLRKCAEVMKKDDCQLANEPIKPPAVTEMTRQQCPTDDLLIAAKLEASRMRIREGYDRAKDAKEQRRIQLLDLHDIPKPVNRIKSCKPMARGGRGVSKWWRR